VWDEGATICWRNSQVDKGIHCLSAGLKAVPFLALEYAEASMNIDEALGTISTRLFSRKTDTLHTATVRRPRRQGTAEHAKNEFPKESCGYIIDGEYVPFLNRSETPNESFICEFPTNGNVEAFVHSHPNANNFPSKSDMEHQICMDVPWIIVMSNPEGTAEIFGWGDSLPMQPLIGREFKHGVTDCYSLIRDFYKTELKINLKDYPRSMNWWEAGENTYLENFEDAGFRLINKEELKHGDMFMARMTSKITCHGGVVLEGGLILHHLMNRLSCREPMGRYGDKFVTHYLRHRENE
jgi:proteasome lid subunit RPN8/RPN11